MTKEHVMSKVDLTILRADTTHQEVYNICRTAIQNGAHSVCVPHYFVYFARMALDELAAEYKIAAPKLCTVVAFPLGNITLESKIVEAAAAIKYGADEIDMVANINLLKGRKTSMLLNEINEVKMVCEDQTLKVIVETALLSEEDKRYACEIILQSNADYIKTSTGFTKAGATLEDIKLFKSILGGKKKIKASGGVKTLAFAAELIRAGADRIGTSSIW